MSRRTDIIVTALMALSAALAVTSVIYAAIGADHEAHMAVGACWAALMALLVLAYDRARR